MRIIDLTYIIGSPGEPTKPSETYIAKLSVKGNAYDGVCHRFQWHSMSGTYIDFPGHISAFDDGTDAANYPPEKLFMVDTSFIRLNRQGKGREITAEELESAGVEVQTPGLFIHARGATPFNVDTANIPYYGPSAIEWIASKKIHLFLSDVYEKWPGNQGIFVELFRRGISCVCCMVGPEQVRQTRVKVSAIPLRAVGAKQAPCRLFVVED